MYTDKVIKNTFLYHGDYIKTFLYPYNTGDLETDFDKMIAKENFTTMFAAAYDGQPYPFGVDQSKNLF